MFGRIVRTAAVLVLGLGLVYLTAPAPRLTPGRDPEVIAAPKTTHVPAGRPRARKARANGLPVSYEAATSNDSPAQILRRFQAEGLTQIRGVALPKANLDGLPTIPGGHRAVRWIQASPDALPTLEALLVFGEGPAMTYRLSLGMPAKQTPGSNPLRDFESRLGITGSGLHIAYGIVDDDGSWVFLGEDPGRKALGRPLAARLGAAGWRAGVISPKPEQGVSCFSRWDREVCILREAGGAVSVSMGMGAPVFQPGLSSGPIPTRDLFQKGIE